MRGLPRGVACFLLLAACAGDAAPPPGKTARPADPPQVRRWLQTLTLRQKVAQLVIVPFYGDAPNVRSREYQQLVRLVRDTRVGGLILINRVRNRLMRRAEPYALAAFLNRMQRTARIPLLDELIAGVEPERELVVRDYVSEPTAKRSRWPRAFGPPARATPRGSPTSIAPSCSTPRSPSRPSRRPSRTCRCAS